MRRSAVLAIRAASAATNSVAALAALVARGADVNAVNSLGDTPLSMALSARAYDAAIWLIGRGAGLGDRNDDG